MLIPAEAPTSAIPRCIPSESVRVPSASAKHRCACATWCNMWHIAEFGCARRRSARRADRPTRPFAPLVAAGARVLLSGFSNPVLCETSTDALERTPLASGRTCGTENARERTRVYESFRRRNLNGSDPTWQLEQHLTRAAVEATREESTSAREVRDAEPSRDATGQRVREARRIHVSWNKQITTREVLAARLRGVEQN